jgi:hypothetical protein
MERTRALLPEYLLGLATDEERREVEAELARSPELAREARLAADDLATLPDRLARATAAQAEPAATAAASRSAAGRARLLATLAGPERFRAFFPTIAGWFDLTDDEVRALLAKVDDDRDGGDGAPGWIAAPFPGVRYLDFQAGPRAALREAGLVRLAAGAPFPRHRHRGPERALVLEGRVVLEGRAFGPGSVLEAAAGSSHEFSAAPGRDLVLIVGHDGVTFSGRDR